MEGPTTGTGVYATAHVRLARGRRVPLTSEPVTGGPDLVPVSHAELIAGLRPRDRVLLADGQIELRVQTTAPNSAVCTVTRGGLLEARKGVISPPRPLPLPALTVKTIPDLRLPPELPFPPHPPTYT